MYNVIVMKDGEQIADEYMKNVVLLGESDDGIVEEMIMHTSIMDMAGMIASSSKVKRAAMLANAMMKIRESMTMDSESNLLEQILGGKEQ